MVRTNSHQGHKSHDARVGSDAGHGISRAIFHEERWSSVDGNVQLWNTEEHKVEETLPLSLLGQDSGADRGEKRTRVDAVMPSLPLCKLDPRV
jgi:hypothetical protein